MKTKPNVLLIIADDMCYGDLSIANGGTSCTPALDRLAGESVRMTQAYSASCVCAPARAALMTGRYPHRTGVVDLNDFHGLNRLSSPEMTLGDLFAANGYCTGLVGKWHLGYMAACHPNRRGFREFHGFLGGSGTYWNWRLDHNGATEHADGRYLSVALTDYALDFVDGAAAGSDPFFLYLGHYAPHRPLEAEPERLQKYLDRPGLTPGQAHVYAMIESMDVGIGRVLDRLAELGVLDDTIVIFTSDNGPDPVSDGALSPVRPNVGLLGTKYQVYEGGIRVPFLARWPHGLPTGAIRHEMIHFTDVMPTLMSLCGLSRPDGPPLDGVSRAAALRGEPEQYGHRFWQWNRYYPIARCNAAMRDGAWKLVYPEIEGTRHMVKGGADLVGKMRNEGSDAIERTPPPERPVGPTRGAELYDLDADPSESSNLAAVHPGRLKTMQGELDRWFEGVMAECERNFSRVFETGSVQQ